MFAYLPLVLAYIMFCLGLQLRVADFLPVFTMPKAVLLGLFNQLLMVPLLAFVLVWVFAPPPAMGLGLMLLSFCAGGATSNLLSYYAGGHVPLSIVLTTLSSLVATVSVPILVSVSYPWFFADALLGFDATALGAKVFVLTTVPVLIGMLLKHLFATVVNDIAPRLQTLANAGFVLLVAAAVLQSWQALMQQWLQIGVLIVLLASVLLLVAYSSSSLLGLSARERTTISIETSLQNGAMGISLASLLVGSTGVPELALPSALYGVLMNVVVLPFVFRKSLRQLFARVSAHS